MTAYLCDLSSLNAECASTSRVHAINSEQQCFTRLPIVVRKLILL